MTMGDAIHGLFVGVFWGCVISIILEIALPIAGVNLP